MQWVRSVRDTVVGTKASAPFDDTLPFPPSPQRAGALEVPAARGAEPPGRSLEQLAEASLARSGGQQQRAPLAPAPDVAVPASRAGSATAQVQLGRLHWRGRELSPEFHEYALRVSRGESLAPFRGRLLADEGHEPPWEAAPARPTRTSTLPRLAVWLLLGGALALVVAGNVASPEASSLQQAAFSPMVIAPVQSSLEPLVPEPVVEPLLAAPPASAAPSSSEAQVPPPMSAASAAPAATSPTPALLASSSPLASSPLASSPLASSPLASSPSSPLAPSLLTPPPAAKPPAPKPPPRRAEPGSAAAGESTKSVLLVEQPPF